MFAEQIGAGVAVVGQARGGWAAKVGIPTRIPLSVRNVMDALFSRRTFWSLNPSAPKQLSAEGGRLLFQLNNVSIDRDSDSVIVNVFVNCPYLEPGTPYTDPHYVGTFALFGGGHASGHAGRTIVVDASDALRGLLRSGRLVVDLLQVQLMAIPASEGGTSDATVTVDAVDAIRA